MDGKKMSFLLRSVNNVLPTLTNLTKWKLIEGTSCKLCVTLANLEHALLSCRTALKDGRYTWRHDQVLREIAAVLDTQRKKKTKIEKFNCLSSSTSSKVRRTVIKKHIQQSQWYSSNSE